MALPKPTLPAVSATPVVSSVMTLLASVVLTVGVSVAVQVMPPSPDVRLESAAFGALRSAVVKPVTASVKVKVTVAVSPTRSAVSLMVMPAASVGRTVSMA